MRAGILSVLWCGLDTAGTLAGKHAFMLYYLAPAMRPRFLLTVDEAGDPLPVAVRVGLAVDTVAQAGQPKSITGACCPAASARSNKQARRRGVLARCLGTVPWRGVPVQLAVKLRSHAYNMLCRLTHVCRALVSVQKGLNSVHV